MKGKRILALAVILGVALALAGCCDKKAALQMAQQAATGVQQYYDPLLGQFLSDPANDKMKQAIVAADTALALIGAIQNGYCASQQETEQLQIQANQAAKLAQEAGVAAAQPVAAVPTAGSQTAPGN